MKQTQVQRGSTEHDGKTVSMKKEEEKEKEKRVT